MKLTFKTQICPTEDQKNILWDMSEQVRRMYNILLGEVLNNWKFIKHHVEDSGCESKHNTTDTTCNFKYHKLGTTQKDNIATFWRDKRNHVCTTSCDDLCYDSMFLWVPSETIQYSAHGKMASSFQSFFELHKKDKNARPPHKFRGKNYFSNLIMRRSDRKFKHQEVFIANKHPCAPKFGKQQGLWISTEQILKYKGVTINDKTAETLEISHTKGKWYANIVFNYTEIPPYVDNGKYLAIDLGQNFIVSAVNSDGRFTQIRNKKAGKFWNTKLQEVMGKRDKCLTYYIHRTSGKVVRSNSHPAGYSILKRSKKWQWYDAKLQRMTKKKFQQVWQFRHKVSHVLVKNTKANTIILGELNTKNMTAKSKPGKSNSKSGLNRALLDTGLSNFVTFLTYKAQLLGKKVVKISERNTTKMCCACGNKKDMSLDKRVYECANCGSIMDRDANSSVNIYNKYIKDRNKKENINIPLLQQWSISDLSMTRKHSVRDSALKFGGVPGLPKKYSRRGAKAKKRRNAGKVGTITRNGYGSVPYTGSSRAVTEGDLTG